MRTTSTLVLALTALLAACSVDPVTFTLGDGDAGHDGTSGDIDAPTGPLTIVVSNDTMTVTEGQSATFTVRLSVPPPDAVLVTLSSSNDTRLGFMPGFLLFSPSNWSVPQTVTLTGKADVDISDESVTVNLMSPSITDGATIAVTVDDDDGLALVLTPTTLDVGEGSTGSVNVHLTAQPTADVVVAVASSDLTVAVVSPATLTFTSANWMSDQSVTINGVQDVDTVPDTAMIVFTSPDLTNAAVTVQVPDDDVLGISTSVSGVSLTEGATSTFTVQLSQLPPGTVAVTVGTMNPAVATATPATLTFTTASWNVAQTVTVTAVADDDVGNGAGAITLSAPSLATRTVAVSVTDDDVQALTATPTTLTVTEGAAGAVTNVRLAFRPAADVTIAVATLAPTLASAAPATLTFSSSNFMVTQAVTVTAPQDADAAGGNTTLRLDASAAGLLRDVPVAVTDDDTLGIEVSTSAIAVTEGMTTTFQVRLTAQPAAATTLTVATSDVTAATANPTSLSFTTSSWNTFQTVTVTGVQDADLAGETVTFTISGPGIVTSQAVTATVTDNDSQIVQASTTTVTVTEGATTTVGVTLGFVPPGNVTVTVASNATTAATASPATLSFTPANYATAQNVTITGVQDADAANGAAMVSLTATGATTATVAVTVTDDDALNLDVSPASITIGEAGTGTLMVRLTAMPPAATTVMVSSADTGAATVGPATVAFTTANWATYQSVTVAGVDDADTANEAVTVTFASAGLTSRNATVTVTDNDVLGIQLSVTAVTLSEGGTATFTARLTAMPPGATTVTVSSTDTGAATAAPTPLTFSTASWMTPQTVTVTGVQDVDLAGEGVNITLTAPGVTTGTVAATVNDDDTQIVQVSSVNATVAEGGTTSVGVTLGFAPSSNLLVTVASGMTAVATASPATLTFTPANYATAQNITIGGAEDANAVSNTTAVALSAPGATGASVAVTVTDNDVLGIELTPASMTISEGGAGTVQIRLTAMPGATTAVAAASNDTGAASVSPASLSFTTANYGTYQNLTVSGVNDGDTNNEAVTVTLTSAGLTTRTVAVTLIDDDFCGNGVCSGGETCSTCSQDCGACCGNNVCDNGETCVTCTHDCLSCCGNHACDNGETCGSCSQDCGACCGDGTCGAGETCSNCAADCGNCCGNHQCAGGETCATCPQDCGSCCGDGICGGGESCGNCAEDCGLCTFCGNGVCETGAGENCINCPSDCNGSLPSAQPIQPQCGLCGDGICQFNECCLNDCGGFCQ